MTRPNGHCFYLIFFSIHLIGFDKVVDLVLKNGGTKRINHEDKTALCYATEHGVHNGGGYKVAELLVKNGADVNTRCGVERTPLHYAVEAKDHISGEYLVKYLYSSFMRYKLTNIQIKFILHIDRLKIVKLLVENGADVNATDQDGRTPLQVLKNGVDEGSVQAIIEYLGSVEKH